MQNKPTNRERLQEITAGIEQGIKELFESEKYMRYLSVMSKFHRYSVNNTMCRHSTADVNSRRRDVRADAAGLEEAVLLFLKKQLEILLPIHEDGTIHLEATAAKCSEYEKQLETLKDQKQALFERYLLGQIELDTYKSEKAVYDAEILKVKNAYAAVTAQAKLKREEQARQSSRQEIVHSIAEADVLTFELTDLLIEKVYVFPDNRIEIVYKVHDLFE